MIFVNVNVLILERRERHKGALHIIHNPKASVPCSRMTRRTEVLRYFLKVPDDVQSVSDEVWQTVPCTRCSVTNM